MKTLMILVIVLLASSAWAQSRSVIKYNPMSDRWETTYPESVNRYNPMEDTWQYVTPHARSNHYRQNFPSLNTYQATPGPVFNPFSGRWEYPH